MALLPEKSETSQVPKADDIFLTLTFEWAVTIIIILQN